MRVLSVAITLVVTAADQSDRQILLSVPITEKTTFKEVYAQLPAEWQEEGISPLDSQTTDEQMDAMFKKELAAIGKRDAGVLNTPVAAALPKTRPPTKVAFFSVTWTTDEDAWDMNS